MYKTEREQSYKYMEWKDFDIMRTYLMTHSETTTKPNHTNTMRCSNLQKLNLRLQGEALMTQPVITICLLEM